MSVDSSDEARRQIEICNACRFCEGYCAVFPAITRHKTFPLSTVSQLANLCHNCRNCYHACQYTEPHEFAINLPQILAKVRQESWQVNAYPKFMATLFHRSGVAIAIATTIGFVILIGLTQLLGPAQGEGEGEGEGVGFYGILSHTAMVWLFAPAFLLPLIAMAISVRRYWRSISKTRFKVQSVIAAVQSAAALKNLSGGHGDGCNFEDEDRFSNARRWYHQATLYGFLLCFAATSSATIMHYAFAMPAPYELFSLPKLLGISGGVILSIGTAGLATLKLRADRKLGDPQVWGGEMAFVLLLFFVSTSGLALYLFAATVWLKPLLILHLGGVLAFFVLTPYSKMAHGFYRMAALCKEAQEQSEQR